MSRSPFPCSLRLPRSGHALRMALRWAGDQHNPVSDGDEIPEVLAAEGWLPWETAAVAAEVAYWRDDRTEIAQAAGDLSARLYREHGETGHMIADHWGREGAEAIRRYIGGGT